MNKISFNNSKALDFFNKGEIDALQPYVNVAHDMLHNGTGLGNDFLGWIELPENYNKEEFAKAVYHAFCNYECMCTYDPTNALDSLEFEETEENKDIIRKQWKKFCKKYVISYQDPFTITSFGY